jgi:hypothetical protein
MGIIFVIGGIICYQQHDINPLAKLIGAPRDAIRAKGREHDHKNNGDHYNPKTVGHTLHNLSALNHIFEVIPVKQIRDPLGRIGEHCPVVKEGEVKNPDQWEDGEQHSKNDKHIYKHSA